MEDILLAWYNQLPYWLTLIVFMFSPPIVGILSSLLVPVSYRITIAIMPNVFFHTFNLTWYYLGGFSPAQGVSKAKASDSHTAGEPRRSHPRRECQIVTV